MKLSHQIGVYAAIALAAVVLVPVGLAGNAGAKKSGSSLSLVVLDSSGSPSASTAPQWGDQVTFMVSTNASYPNLQLACYQSGAIVFNQTIGAFPSYAGSQDFTLESPLWTGGAADCIAVLYTTNKNGSNTTLATLSFAVAA